VRRLFPVLLGIVCLALASFAAGSALAQGTDTSAGDQQYVDPLTSTNGSQAKSKSSSTSSSTQSSPQSSSAAPATSGTSTGTSTASSGTTATAPAPSTAAHSSGDALPYTGLNIEALTIVGVALLGGGLLLRFVLRRA
jgi:LPXTG-motif cell wall-anchored protein